jgi:hypothetical protein
MSDEPSQKIWQKIVEMDLLNRCLLRSHELYERIRVRTLYLHHCSLVPTSVTVIRGRPHCHKAFAISEVESMPFFRKLMSPYNHCQLVQLKEFLDDMLAEEVTCSSAV